eukprot:evm.model.NODE_44498_length_37240_cov_46.992050.1
MPMAFLEGHRRNIQVGVATVGVVNIVFFSAAGSPQPYDDDAEDEGLPGEETLPLNEEEEKEERDDSDGAGLEAS